MGRETRASSSPAVSVPLRREGAQPLTPFSQRIEEAGTGVIPDIISVLYTTLLLAMSSYHAPWGLESEASETAGEATGRAAEPDMFSHAPWFSHPETAPASPNSPSDSLETSVSDTATSTPVESDWRESVSGCARCDPFGRSAGKEKRWSMRGDLVVCQRMAAENKLSLTAHRQGTRKCRNGSPLRPRPALSSRGKKAYASPPLRAKLVGIERSHIHGWGLYALQDIGREEMILEYVGEKVRSQVAERREVEYQRRGMGSSYLFRLDANTVIDATEKGNVARYINHSCDPTSYAKEISIEGSKRMCIFSKTAMSAGDEITYDYKFPLEENKIPCLCASANCRGSLN